MSINEEYKELLQLVDIYSNDKRGVLLKNLISENERLAEANQSIPLLTKKAKRNQAATYMIALLTCLQVTGVALGATVIQISIPAIAQLILLFTSMKEG